jgi:hemerythrin superfamily protein
VTHRARNIQARQFVSTLKKQQETDPMAATKAPDAITLLKNDHREVEKLFKEFEKAKGDGRKQKLAHQICLELIVHSELEETIFYPACEGIVDEDELKEGYVEHDAAKLMIAEIIANEGADDEFFDTKVHVLQEEIEHHIEEEEGRGGIFAQARKGKLDTEGIGEQLQKRKSELLDEYKAKGLPQPKLRTMDEVSV